MLKFYFSKGSSALAAHILLEEVGADYEAIEVSIPNGDHLSSEFLQLNPKGRIPVLETPSGVISENPAILEFIATTCVDAKFLPVGEFEKAQARSLCAYLCATAHVAYAHKHRGHRWADADASQRDMQDLVPRNLAACADHLETQLGCTPWSIGATYTFCDPYLFQFTRWLAAADVPIDGYPKLGAHRKAVLARPATQAILARHDLKPA